MRMQRLKTWIKRSVPFLTVVAFVIMEIHALHMYEKMQKCKDFTENKAKFQRLAISSEWITSYMEEMEAVEKENLLKKMTLGMLYYDFNVLDVNQLNRIPILWEWMMKQEVFSSYFEKYKVIFTDLKSFPVPEDVEGGATISFEDTWGAERNYGEGGRTHEGTDVMTSNNERGYFPIISVTDGVVEKKGWLEKGGYRIGIRSPSGAYFYYAHFCEYVPDMEVGDEVHAGRLLGSMGDSGYGTEGTVGQFDVHLHLGVYIDVDGQEMGVNPYHILKALEKKRITFRRKME